MSSIARRNYWSISGFVFLYFAVQATAIALLSIWLSSSLKLTGTEIGVVFSANAIIAMIAQPIYGIISDKFGLKKNILWIIAFLAVATGPFFIFVYKPLLLFSPLLGAIIGGLYIGAAFQAGGGAVESYADRVARTYGFEYGRVRMFGSIGFAAMSFFLGPLMNMNPNYNFVIGSLLGIILLLLLLVMKIDPQKEAEMAHEKAEPFRINDIWALLKSGKFWAFVVYVVSVPTFYMVCEQQFPIHYAASFTNAATGNQFYGYLNSVQVFIEAGMLFVAPLIVVRIGIKRGLLLANSLMIIRLLLAGIVVAPVGLSFVKLISGIELPILLVSIFKYISAHFSSRVSSTLYLIGFQFSLALGQTIYSPVIGNLYDTIGFNEAYVLMGGIALIFTIIAVFTLRKDDQDPESTQEGTLGERSEKGNLTKQGEDAI
ncbi:oligosaccharide MFS transporter [Paenibacillus maysiensis]|uniref:oligosaccharide MFS transporter n=1 Tax=Paenibacillus maysiensis TaxID=1155954 RepID=UPI000470F035|nr:oligosaccharide MFS transporter [Paenibacillus maysiensis]